MDVITQTAVDPNTAFVGTTLTDPNAVWSSATTYALGARVTYMFRIYQSLQATNLNNTPPTMPVYQDDPLPTAWWVFVGPDNRAAMFDYKGNTLSSATTSFSRQWIGAKTIASIAVLNVEAVTVRLTARDNSAAGTIVYDQTRGLADATIGNWYDYFFAAAFTTITQIIFDSIPPPVSSNNNYYELFVTGATGATVSVGTVVGGSKYFLGLTQYGVSCGIIDYSKKTTDDYGNVKITRRAFSKRMEGDVEVANADVSRIQALMYSLRSTQCVWIAEQTDKRFQELLIVYGFYRDFNTKISYPNHSLMTIQIEGLI